MQKEEEIFMNKESLLKHLKDGSKVLKNPFIEKAFEAVDRADFVSDDYKVEAYEDYPLPTIENQTISQPTTVAFMLELLDPKPGDFVLDIGSGSGFTTALLGNIVGKDGRVIGIELLPNLVELGQKNIKKYKNLSGVIEIKKAEEDEIGLYKEGPYNKILVSAAFENKEDALELMVELLPKGILVAPIGESIFKFEKLDDDKFEETEFPGFTFVPYVRKEK